MFFCLIYHADSAIAHTLAPFSHFVQNARPAGMRFEKSEKKQRVCAQYHYQHGIWAKNIMFFIFSLIQINSGHTDVV